MFLGAWLIPRSTGRHAGVHPIYASEIQPIPGPAELSIEALGCTMLILGRLSSRVDVSLSLTVANEVVSLLRQHFSNPRELVVAAGSVSVLLSFAGVASSKSESGIFRIVSLFRRLSVLVMSDLLMGLVKPVDPLRASSLGVDLRVAMSPSSEFQIPLTANKPIEAFAIGSCLIVCIGFLVKQVRYLYYLNGPSGGNLRHAAPESSSCRKACCTRGMKSVRTCASSTGFR